MTRSWTRLKSVYKDFLNANDIGFQVGTHDIPGSITTHRYQRIIRKNRYKEIVVWGSQDYYGQMEDAFAEVKKMHFVADESDSNVLDRNIQSAYFPKEIDDSIPVFICSKHKQEIKMKIRNSYPDYKGKSYV